MNQLLYSTSSTFYNIHHIIKRVFTLLFRMWWRMKIKISLLEMTTFPHHLHRRNISALSVTNNFQLHQTLNIIWEFIVEKNLSHALTVVKNLLAKMAWRDTYEHTPVNVPSPALFVRTLLQINQTLVLTFAHTQGKNQSPVMCVGSLSLKAVIWNYTNWLIQGRSLTRVNNVGSHLVRGVL